MKKTFIIAAAIAALLSCTKDNQPQDNDEGNSFKKGQQVTLNVTADASATKVTSELNGTAVDFKWQAGDKIKVTVGTESAEFTLASGEGTNFATFSGTMPDDGETFDVQYPVNDPDLTTQTYSYSSTEAIPHDKMKLAATGCTLGTSFSLEAQYAALRLNLYGALTVESIDVSDGSSTTYTLNCGSGVTLGTTEATATRFFIVVPVGSMKFTATVNYTEPVPLAKPECCVNGLFTVSAANKFTPSSSQNFEKGEVLNMDAMEVSCAKKVYFTKGNLYYSSTDSKYHFETEQNVTYVMLGQSTYDATHVCHFFWVTPSEATVAATAPWAESFGTHTQTTSDKFFCGIDDPMEVDGQSGLYALTGGISGEWYYLINSRANASSLYKYGVSVTTSAGTASNCLVIAPDDWDYTSNPLQSSYDASAWATAESDGLVCLPAAGGRNGSSLYFGGSIGYYWSATPYEDGEDGAYYLDFFDSNVIPDYNDYRGIGYSVRLVSAAQ